MGFVDALCWVLAHSGTARDMPVAAFNRPSTVAMQAGLIMVGIANGLTIIFMGLYDTDADKVSMHMHGSGYPSALVGKPSANPEVYQPEPA